MTDLKRDKVTLTLLAQSIRGEAVVAARPGQMTRLMEMADEIDQLIAGWGVVDKED